MGFGSHSIQFEGARVWNHLPNKIRCAENLASFKKNSFKQDTRIQKFEADGSQRDGEAALQGRGSGIRGFVGQRCGERRNEMACILVERGPQCLPRDFQEG